MIMKNRIVSLLLTLCLTLGLATPALAADTAANIRLSKTSGTVTVSKSSGKALSLLSNMRLYNGYHVATSAKSYAWMNLDDTKLIKEDAASEVEVRKSGKNLEVNVCSGNVFFNVSESLEDNESLNISPSTMITGIRGTAGYVKVVDRWTTYLTVLEGEVQCSVSDPVTGQIKTELVRGGEGVQCVVYPQDKTGDKCDILRDKLEVADIPGFVLYDVVRDMDLCDRIYEDTGTDILEELAKVVGGDPSGRSPDGTSASPEILGEADRRESADETVLQEKQEQVDAAVNEQDTGDSPDKVFGQQPTTGSDSFGGGSSAQTATTTTMPVTGTALQALLNQYNSVTLQPSANAANNTLDASGLTVPAGKTLDIQDGIQTSVPAGGNLQVNGTLNGGSIDNQGTTTVSSSNTLRLSGNLTSSGTLTVTSTGRVVVDGSWSVSTLTLSSGAQVLSRNGFGSTPLTTGWAVSETADSSGYYSLVEVQTEVTYTVTFDPNGGGTAPDSQTVNYGGTVTEPAAPARTGYTFSGWNTKQDGSGSTWNFTGDTVTADTTLYAQWTIEQYTVTFDLDSGKWTDSSIPTEFTVREDGTLPMTIPDPVKDGYAFDGWYISGEENEAGEPTQQKITPNEYRFTEDTTVYAVWTESILDLDLSSYGTQAEAQAAIQTALNGSVYTRVNVTSSTSTFSMQDDLTVPAGKALNLDCPFTLGSADGSTQGTLTVNGTLFLNYPQTGTVYSGSKISVAGTGTIVDYGNVTVNSSGAVENAGTFNTAYGYNNCLIIEAGGTFTNTGKLHLGYFDAFKNNGTFTNAAGGVLDGGAGSGTNQGTFINSGTVASSATITNASGGTLTNNGTIESSSFTNQTGGTLTNNGSLINEEYGNFYNNGTITNNSTITNNGNLYNRGVVIENKGTFTNTGNVAESGNFNNYGTLTNQAGATFTGYVYAPGDEAPVECLFSNVSGAVVENYGTFELTGNCILSNSGIFTNKSGGNVTNNSRFTNETDGTLTNEGTYYGDAITGGTIDGTNAGQVTAGNPKPEEETP